MRLRGLRAGHLAWSLSGSWANQVINLLTFLLLARLLGPEPYGIVGLAAVALALAWAIIMESSAEFLVRSKTLAPGHLNATFWLQLVLGGLIAVGMWRGMGWAGAATGEPELRTVLPILAVVPLLYALASAQRALLQRALEFKILAGCSLASAVGGGAVGIVMALQGFGAVSLAVMILAQLCVLTTLLWWHSPWRPGTTFARAELREVTTFGLHLSFGTLATLVELQGIRLMIGLTAGPAVLGLFTLGWRIVEVVGTLLLMPVNQVAIPILSPLQHDPAAFAERLKTFIQVTTSLAFPAYAGLAAVAPLMVPLLFGPEWTEATHALQVLSLLGVGWALSFPLDAAIVSTGQVAARSRVSLVGLVVVLVGSLLVALLDLGLVGFTAVVVARQGVVIPLFALVLWRSGYLNVAGLAFELSMIALSTGLMIAVVEGWQAAIASPGPSTLAVAIGLGAIAYVVSMWCVARGTARDVIGMLLPGRLRAGDPHPAA